MTIRSELEKRTVETSLGPITFWSRPEIRGETRPVLLLVLGAFLARKDVPLSPLPLDAAAQLAFVELPIRERDGFERPNLERLSSALGLAIHDAFRRRPVIVIGFEDAAPVALMAFAPEIVRSLVVEPPVLTARISGLLDDLRQSVGSDASTGLQVYLADIYGLKDGALAPRDHRAGFQNARAPVDVIVGPAGSASRVDSEARAWLAAEPRASLRITGDAGARTAAGSPDDIWAVARDAVADLDNGRRDASAIARQLANAAPRDARKVLFFGPPDCGFVDAYAAVNPMATCISEPDDPGKYDLIVLLDPNPSQFNWVELVDRLEPMGRLVASTPLGLAGDRIGALLAACGMSLVHDDPIIPPAGSALVRARNGTQKEAARVEIVPFARVLMDIRTRLPADGLRSDFDLQIRYTPPPPHPGEGGLKAPKVVIFQRPPNASAAAWSDLAAKAILARKIMVIEYDDHPELVSQMVQRRSLTPDEWARFRVVHAVQTSTDALIDVFGQYNPEVKVFANSVFDLARFDPATRPARVFYGGVTRGAFAQEVARSLGPAIEAYPDTEFFVLGDRAFFDALPTQRKSFSNYVPYDRYLQIMAACRISLSPLQYRPMMETKSDAKYLDASRAGVVTIASPTVYERTIRSSENGFIARTLEDWPKMLAALLGDPALCERVARTAWEDVRSNRMFAHQIADRRDWYAGLLARQDSLDQAVLARCPDVAARLSQLRMNGL